MNLMPWRHARKRVEQKKYVGVCLLGTVLVAGAYGVTENAMEEAFQKEYAAQNVLGKELAIVAKKGQEEHVVVTPFLPPEETVKGILAVQAIVETMPATISLRRLQYTEKAWILEGQSFSQSSVLEWMRSLEEGLEAKAVQLFGLEKKEGMCLFNLKIVPT